MLSMARSWGAHMEAGDTQREREAPLPLHFLHRKSGSSSIPGSENMGQPISPSAMGSHTSKCQERGNMRLGILPRDTKNFS